MHWDLSQYLLIAAVLLASSVLQGAVGFAAGLFGTPILVLCGVKLHEAVTINLVSSALQNSLAAWRMRKDIDFARARRPLLIRLLTLPLGALALFSLGGAGQGLVSQLVGVIVLCILGVQWCFQTDPRDEIPWGWEWLAFGLGGFLLGLCGMGGPPMVLWVMAHKWPVAKAKAFLFYIFASGLIPQGILLYLFFGNAIFLPILYGLAAAPSLIGGTLAGLWFGARIPDAALRRLSIFVLALIALTAILTPWIK